MVLFACACVRASLEHQTPADSDSSLRNPSGDIATAHSPGSGPDAPRVRDFTAGFADPGRQFCPGATTRPELQGSSYLRWGNGGVNDLLPGESVATAPQRSPLCAEAGACAPAGLAVGAAAGQLPVAARV